MAEGLPVFDPRSGADRPTPGEYAALSRRADASPGALISPRTTGAPAPAASDRRQGAVSAGRRTPPLGGDHVFTVRRAVAATLPPHQPRLTERVLAGEADHLPLMRAAYAAAERVLAEMFS